MITAAPADLYGQGVSFPPRIGPDGAMVTSAGELNVRECICTILRTRPGERAGRPSFGAGLARFLFEPNTVATLRLIQEEAQRALSRWEPRIALNGVTATVSAADPRDVDVTITYTLIASGVQQRLAMTISADT
jgi:phage baseplate assembly protein W